MVGDVLIEDMPIPFTAVATDLLARREVWFQQGPLMPAIRASMAIPGLFTPAVVAGRVLVDGGLLNPLPLDPTAAAAADFTFAVSLQGPRGPNEASSPDREFSRRSPEWDVDLRHTSIAFRHRRGTAFLPRFHGGARAAGARGRQHGATR